MNYPINLELAGKLVLLVGGSRLAEAYAKPLLNAGARLKVVAPELSAGLNRLVETAKLQWEKRTFLDSDLVAAWLVLA
ncbi:MAG: hypothetical protein HY692_02160, partial [Cyanobacteria bacterium NC_groundwater_1444_Ag_S-0.65um_54_12]|nr:hypothetical protein [Cyanobacteria bacterium NC_groundwater_1444_Ag_S-0.65um_54_12]